jgi:hypothetical protein
MNSLVDRIMFDWWYPVAMFPSWIVEKHPRKIVRAVGLALAFPWFMAFIPLTFLLILFCIPLMIWEDV